MAKAKAVSRTIRVVCADYSNPITGERHDGFDVTTTVQAANDGEAMLWAMEECPVVLGGVVRFFDVDENRELKLQGR